MSFFPKYSAVITRSGSSITVKQFFSSTDARLYYNEAKAQGKDVYLYFMPLKRRTNTINPAPIEVTL